MDFDVIFGNGLRAAIGPEAAIYALLAIGLNLHWGYTGLLNLGQVGFMLVGAYGLAITVATWGWSMWLGVPVGLLAAAALALALGIPTLRLRADYFAITTIAVAEILRLVVRSRPAQGLTGGAFGLQGIAQPFYDINPIPRGTYGFGVVTFSENRLWVMTVTWVLVLLCTGLLVLLTSSPWGRVLRSIREDEDAARSLGKNVVAFKMQALIIGGMIGGLAGVMFAIRASSANAESYRSTVTFFAYTILILGGAATRLGPIVGAFIFWFVISGVESFLRQADSEGYLPGFLQGTEAVGAVTFILVGLALGLLIVFRPQGIFGNRNELRLET
ncbi:MAG: branched-chain amino acid ABC transporter permease [Acidimicrobiia bacterium]